MLASVVAVGVSMYPREQQSSEPQKVSMDGYGWTTFGPTGSTWMCAYTVSGYCVPVAGGGGMARAD